MDPPGFQHDSVTLPSVPHLCRVESGTAVGSLRHTFVDALRAARTEEAVIQSIVGQSSGNVTRQYGSGYPANVLHDAISQVAYAGLDVSHLER